jgi:hypothetical protein
MEGDREDPMKDRRIYFIFVALFFAALLDLYFWSHVLAGDNRYGCSTSNPRHLGCDSDLGTALTIAITILAVLVGLVVRFISVRKSGR